MRCSKCGTDNPSGGRFCTGCAAPLGGTAGAPPAAPEAERRQLTVLFCDLVGSTALSADLDPEELRELVRDYQEACAEAVHRYEGHIAQYLGDGILVYFGYPRAHEDDAVRGVRAARAIVEAIGRLNARLERERGRRVAVRLGLHTGLTVVGEMGGGARREQLALGETPNVAARLQALAEPDAVVISEATHRLVAPFFTVRDLGPQTLKGMGRALAAFEVLAESGVRSRLDAATATGMTPLVGRERELAFLLDRWERAKGGRGQVVLLIGEPGIGKSRQLRVLKDRLAAEPHVRLDFRCSAYHQASAFHPVIDLLERVLGFQGAQRPEERWALLEGALEQFGFPLAETAPLFAALLSLPPAAAYPAPDLSPQRQRQLTLESLMAWLAKTAARQPVLLLAEDLHWADPSTLELLGLFVAQEPPVPILALASFRPEFQPPWTAGGHVASLAMDRLTREDTAAMVSRVARGKRLPAEVLEAIVARTDGVPLFVEELTKTVLESGALRENAEGYTLAGPLRELAIPTTVQDSLMARLDRLGSAKAVAQLGATLGREFRHDVLQAVSVLEDDALARELGQLEEAELVSRRGDPPQATYVFKHALVQDTAYQSLLRSTRQQYHRQVAQVLVERFPETAETQPEVLAQHYTGAGMALEAITHWQRAGQRTMERSANVEAVSHFTQGLELVAKLPEGPERAGLELMLQAPLGFALVFTRGYAAPEVERTFSRVRALCEQLGQPPQLYPALYGLWSFAIVRSQYDSAHQLGTLLLSLGEQQGDPGLVLEAHACLALIALFGRADLSAAREHFERALAIYDPEAHAAHSVAFGQDPGVLCLSYGAWALWLLGHPDQALASHRRALALAEQRGHAHSRAYALGVGASFRQLRREPALALELAETSIAYATERGFPVWVMAAAYTRGWALNEQGRCQEALAQLRAAIEGWRTIGAQLTRPHQLGLLARTHMGLGEIEAGLAAAAQGLAEARQTGEAYYEAELLRIQAELHLAKAPPDETQAEAALARSLARARAQGARAWELRTATTLARLWRRQGKPAEARALLGPVHGGFVEGLDTPDLEEARELLAELG
jgi:class 3 adenylate cyclase/predicted ATPase